MMLFSQLKLNLDLKLPSNLTQNNKKNFLNSTLYQVKIIKIKFLNVNFLEITRKHFEEALDGARLSVR